MKTLILSLIMISITNLGFAQTKSETLKVAGECNTCKKKIEGAAKKAGASYAIWNSETKELTIKYNSSSTNTAKIEKAIAGVGYDTPGYKATDKAYNKLDECCQYERGMTKTSCCDDEKCTSEKCMNDGKCDKDMNCCKEAGCDKKDCCKS